MGNVVTGYDGQMNVEVKPSMLLVVRFDYRGRCPRLPTSASRRVLPSRQGYLIIYIPLIYMYDGVWIISGCIMVSIFMFSGMIFRVKGRRKGGGEVSYLVSGEMRVYLCNCDDKLHST